MADLSVAASVTRTELSLSPLDLNDGTSYTVFNAGPGSLSWRTQEVDSLFVHGNFLVSAVKDVEQGILGIRCKGTSMSELNANIAALLRAFEQFSYTLTLTIGGEDNSWLCQPADYSPGDGGTWNKYGLMSLQQEYTFSIPRNPIPVAGPQ